MSREDEEERRCMYGSRRSGCGGETLSGGNSSIWDANKCHYSFMRLNAALLLLSFVHAGWQTTATHFQMAACSWSRRLISLPPPRGYRLYIWNRQTYSNVYTSFLELRVGNERVQIYHLPIQGRKTKTLVRRDGEKCLQCARRSRNEIDAVQDDGN